MTQKDQLIASLRAADITKDDWYYSVINSLPDLYARGFISCYRELGLSDNLSPDDEDYRNGLIKAAGWDIWGKS